MTSPASDDIASLCEEVGVPLPKQQGPSGGPSNEVAADGSTVASDSAAGSWSPLLLILPPGIDVIVDTIKPPLMVIKVVLEIIKAILQILKILLLELPDLYRALILAACQLLENIINDIINAGVYLYADVPGVTSPLPSLDDLGIPSRPGDVFQAGKQGAPPPPIVPDAFDMWGHRFLDSFNDPGDVNRPVFSDGASVSALFIVGVAPSFDALRSLIYLLGKLCNIDAFLHLHDYPDSPDPDLYRARAGFPVAPDWRAMKFKDLVSQAAGEDITPQLQKLLAIPNTLRKLLLPGDGLTKLLADIIQAIIDKVQVLSDLIDAIQAVIDLLDALKSAGFHALQVSTTEGPQGLKDGFIAAANRPAGGFMGGICMLIGGPGAGEVTVIKNMFAAGNAVPGSPSDIIDQIEAGVENATAPLDQAMGEATDAATAMADAVQGSPDKAAAALGRSVDELLAASPAELAGMAAGLKDNPIAEAAEKGAAWTDQMQKRGLRSLAFSLGAPPQKLPEPPPRPAPTVPRRPVKKVKKKGP